MSDKHNGFAEDVVNVVRGLCMGAADIVPGVSGGTIALILGHYERLVTAISKFDLELLRLLQRREFRGAIERVDARFLLGLGIGIVTAIVALASLMHYLLEHQQAYIYAIFFGLILGSSYLVAQRLREYRWAHLPLGVVGAAIAWSICMLSPMQGNLTPLTAFLAATVAICAMILPGISGAFVLLLLGLYHPITDLIKGLPRGEVTAMGLLIVACFGLGCAVGLISFTKFLKWLLARHHDATMSLLVGLMLGSLVKIWPFQRVTTETAELPFKEQQFQLLSPWDSPASLWLVVLLTIGSLLFTLGLEAVGQRLSPKNGIA